MIFKQIIAYTKQNEIKNVIFISEDKKADWLHIENFNGKKILGARHELKRELYKEAKVNHFLIYDTEFFMAQASRYLQIEFEAKTLENIKQSLEENHQSRLDEDNFDNEREQFKRAQVERAQLRCEQLRREQVEPEQVEPEQVERRQFEIEQVERRQFEIEQLERRQFEIERLERNFEREREFEIERLERNFERERKFQRVRARNIRAHGLKSNSSYFQEDIEDEDEDDNN